MVFGTSKTKFHVNSIGFVICYRCKRKKEMGAKAYQIKLCWLRSDAILYISKTHNKHSIPYFGFRFSLFPFFILLSLISIKYFQFKGRHHFYLDIFYVNLCLTYTLCANAHRFCFSWPHVLSMSDIERNVRSLLRDAKRIYSKHKSNEQREEKHKNSHFAYIFTHKWGFSQAIQHNIPAEKGEIVKNE